MMCGFRGQRKEKISCGYLPVNKTLTALGKIVVANALTKVIRFPYSKFEEVTEGLEHQSNPIFYFI